MRRLPRTLKTSCNHSVSRTMWFSTVELILDKDRSRNMTSKPGYQRKERTGKRIPLHTSMTSRLAASTSVTATQKARCDAHSLNNTAVAAPRILVSLVENFQQADGSILI